MEVGKSAPDAIAPPASRTNTNPPRSPEVLEDSGFRFTPSDANRQARGTPRDSRGMLDASVVEIRTATPSEVLDRQDEDDNKDFPHLGDPAVKLDVSEVNREHFDFVSLIIELKWIQDPPQTSRGITLEQKFSSKNSLAVMRYSASVGTIAVAFKNGNGVHSRQLLRPHTRIEEEVYCIDGRYRKAAIADLLAEAGPEAGKFAGMARSLCVCLWYSKENNVLKNSETLGLSQYLNFCCGCSLRVSFKDRTHASLAQMEQEVAIEKMTTGEVATAFQNTNAIGSIGTRQLKRDAQIGLSLASETDLFPRFLFKFEAEPRLSLSHVCSNRLLRVNGDGILFCLDAVIERIIVPCLVICRFK